MKFILSIVIIFLLMIVQTSLYPFLQIDNSFPNLILILILILSILQGYKKSLIWILVGGFFLDVFSFNNPIGVSIIGLFLAGYLAHFFSQNIFKKASIFSLILIGISGTLIYRLFLTMALLIAGVGFQFSFNQTVIQIIYNLIILIPLFYFLIKRLAK